MSSTPAAGGASLDPLSRMCSAEETPLTTIPRAARLPASTPRPGPKAIPATTASALTASITTGNATATRSKNCESDGIPVKRPTDVVSSATKIGATHMLSTSR